MISNIRLLATASTLAVSALAASPAFAEGTAAGTTITNEVTLSYKVGGVDQNAVTTSDSFTVDRKVNFVVVEAGSTTTNVSPGEANAVTAFMVTNASNAPLDFALSASQLSGGSAAHGGTDNYNGSNLRIFADTNNNGSYDSGVDLSAAYLDQVPADESRRVFLLLDIPLGRSTADVAAVRLTATAAEATAAGSQGATVTQTTGANTSGVDTVFADTDANGNTARDGIHFAADDYTIVAAAITATKTSRVIKDPVNDTTNPKMIPGATVEYCIAVANAAGGATATGLNVTDALQAATTYDASFGVLVNGTVTGSTCNADGASTGSHNAGTVSATMADLAPGATRTVLFRVTID
jgi:hypothetical protein